MRGRCACWSAMVGRPRTTTISSGSPCARSMAITSTGVAWRARACWPRRPRSGRPSAPSTPRRPSVAPTSPSSLVIGSDQVISLDGAIFGKPKTRENAIKQLLTLQKSPHQLITSVCIATESKTINFSNQTKLTIRRDLSREDISNYVSKDDPLDCAGSYKIEGMGIALFEKVETTDFTSIIGLPLMELSKHLKSFGIKVFS